MPLRQNPQASRSIVRVERPTSYELAALLRCHRQHTTDRYRALERAAAAVLPALASTTASGRPDRAAQRLLAFARDLHRLAEQRPEAAMQLLLSAGDGREK